MFIFRIESGSLVSLSTTDMKAIEPNNGHYSGDILFATHSSHMLPKGSPLMVSWHNCNKIGHVSMLALFYSLFTVQFSKHNYVAKGHWDTEQVEGWCDKPTDAHPSSKSEAKSAPHPKTTRDHNDYPCCRTVHFNTDVSQRAVDIQKENWWNWTFWAVATTNLGFK